MRIFQLLLVFMLAWLASCSRESNIRPNASLKDGRFVVLVLKERPDSLARYIDSIAAVDTLVLPDTVGFTVNDTAWLVGYKFKNGENVQKYSWFVQGQEPVAGANGALYPVTFADSGVYQIKFVAVDGVNGRDSAGTNRYLHIVSSPPQVNIFQDTVWARHASPALVPFQAGDQFGAVERVRLDFDANGTWDSVFTFPATAKIQDTLWAQIPQRADSINANGDQRAVIQVEDDDAQTATDTVILHFNRLPELSLDFPTYDSRVSNTERFAFYYHGEDADNPDQLRYFLRLHKSQSLTGTDTIPSDADLILSNSEEITLELLDKDGQFNPQLDPALEVKFRGTLYWQVWCTDGFDTVYSNISKFFLGDLSQKTGVVTGYVQMEGHSNHSGIRVSLENTETGNFIYARTDVKGFYRFAEVDPGFYLLEAKDTTGLGFPSVGLDDQLYVEMGGWRQLDTLWLTDNSKPQIFLDEAPPTLYTTRDDYWVKWFVGDYGSLTASTHATLAGEALTVTKVGQLWQAQLPTDRDGNREVKIWAVDYAGNVSDTTVFQWVVNAKKATLEVVGRPAPTGVLTTPADQMQFKATLTDVALISPTLQVQWRWVCQDGTPMQSEWGDPETPAIPWEVTYNLELTSSCFEEGGLYTMQFVADDGSGMLLLTDMGFSIRESGVPSVTFVKPSRDTTIAVNTPLAFETVILNALGAVDASLFQSMTCGTSETCTLTPSGTPSGTASWSVAGTYDMVVTVEEEVSGTPKTATATRKVTVKDYSPTVRIRYKDSLSVVVNQPVTLTAVAFDTLGTSLDFQWKCGTASWSAIAPEHSYASNSATDTYTHSPSTVSSNYLCEVRVTDYDGKTATASTKINVLSGLPKVQVGTQNATVTIKDTLRLQALASDTLGGTIESARWSCGAPSATPGPGTVGEYWIWPSEGKMDTIAIAPDTAATVWLCVVEVEDNDGNTARDTSVYNVLLAPPTVNAVYDQLTYTIKDPVTLDAYATDSYGGRVVKYEWSCATAGVAGKGNWVESVGTPRYVHTLPSTADANYMCVIRVTDDDGQTAMDTTRITVLQDAPVVTVSPKTQTVALGLKIALNATATDGYGQIVKREWSCAASGVTQWKTVSQYDTTWTSPTTMASPYYCIARATDDDGNVRQDTMTVTLTSELPTLALTPAVIYVQAGDPFEATVVFEGAWPATKPETHWQCGESPTYVIPAPQTTAVIGGEWTQAGNDISCVVTAAIDANNEATATMQVKVLKNPPVGVITAPESTFVWSGDELVPTANKYFYTAGYNGSSSIKGTLGAPNGVFQFYWGFSHFEPEYRFLGNSDGSIDTSIYQFNEAFIRLNEEGSITLKMQFRDSVPLENRTPDYYFDFDYRHAAAEVQKTVKFYRAWQTQKRPDTVVAPTSSAIPPRMVYFGGGPVVAYVDASGNGRVLRVTSSTTEALGGSLGAVSSSLRLATDGTVLYAAYINASGQVVVKRFNSSQQWVTEGAAFGTAINRISLVVNPENQLPLVACRNTSNDGYVYAFNGTSWQTLSSPLPVDWKTRTMDLAVSPDGDLGVIFVGTGTNFKVYYQHYSFNGSSYTKATNYETAWTAGDTALSCVFNGSEFWLLTPDRNNNGNPLVRKRVNGSWSTIGSGAFAMRIGGQSSIAVASDGRPVVAFDDRIWHEQSQIHVWKYNGSQWTMLGENQLPYFGKVFRDSHGYYLRGATPTLAVNSSQIYLGMRALEMGLSADQVLPNRNNGVLVQKYIGP